MHRTVKKRAAKATGHGGAPLGLPNRSPPRKRDRPIEGLDTRSCFAKAKQLWLRGGECARKRT
jgi:hypothetical protein